MNPVIPPQPENHDARVIREAAEAAKQGLRRVRGEDLPPPCDSLPKHTSATPPQQGSEDWLDKPVTIHFKENSIPSLRRGVLTDESKQSIIANQQTAVEQLVAAEQKKYYHDGYHKGLLDGAKAMRREPNG